MFVLLVSHLQLPHQCGLQPRLQHAGCELSRLLFLLSALLHASSCCRVLQSNGFDPPFTFDSPQAAAAALSAGGAAAGQQPQAQPESLVTAGGGVGAQQQQRSSASKLQVLLAFNSVDVTAGATEPDVPGGADMRPENVQSWFTKVGHLLRWGGVC